MSSDQEASINQNTTRNYRQDPMMRTAAFHNRDSIHSFRSPDLFKTNYEQPPWNNHFGTKSTINKQYPAGTHNCSIYDVTSLEGSQSRPEHTRELCKRRSLLREKMTRTGKIGLTIQSPKFKGDAFTTRGNMTTEGPATRLSVVHDSLYSQGSVDIDD